jgi:hypothetical protein
MEKNGEKIIKYAFGYNCVRSANNKHFAALQVPQFPQRSKKALKLYHFLESVNLSLGSVVFPAEIKYSRMVIREDLNATLSNLSFNGIFNAISIANIDPERKTFFKVEIKFLNKTDIVPELIIHFYEFDQTEGLLFEDADSFLEFAFITYDSTKIFTEKRMEEMKKRNIPVNELYQVPFMPIERIYLKNGLIEPIGYFEDAKEYKLEDLID